MLADVFESDLDADNLEATEEECEAREEEEDEEAENAIEISNRGQDDDDEDEDEEDEDEDEPRTTLNSQRGATGGNASQNTQSNLRLNNEEDEEESNSSSETSACSVDEMLDEAVLTAEDVPVDLEQLGSELTAEACEELEELIQALVLRIRPEPPVIYRGREGFR